MSPTNICKRFGCFNAKRMMKGTEDCQLVKTVFNNQRFDCVDEKSHYESNNPSTVDLAWAFVGGRERRSMLSRVQ